MVQLWLTYIQVFIHRLKVRLKVFVQYFGQQTYFEEM